MRRSRGRSADLISTITVEGKGACHRGFRSAANYASDYNDITPPTRPAKPFLQIGIERKNRLPRAQRRSQRAERLRVRLYRLHKSDRRLERRSFANTKRSARSKGAIRMRCFDDKRICGYADVRRRAA